MANSKQASKRKGARKALPVFGAAGASLAMTGGASASVVPSADLPWKVPVGPVVTLSEEELSDVNLGTFYVFDRESAIPTSVGTKIAQRCGRCGGCRGCAAARCAAARCAVARCGTRCAVGVARCGCARCGVWRCARCGCSCSGCAAPCWIWGAGWVYIC